MLHCPVCVGDGAEKEIKKKRARRNRFITHLIIKVGSTNGNHLLERDAGLTSFCVALQTSRIPAQDVVTASNQEPPPPLPYTLLLLLLLQSYYSQLRFVTKKKKKWIRVVTRMERSRYITGSRHSVRFLPLLVCLPLLRISPYHLSVWPSLDRSLPCNPVRVSSAHSEIEPSTGYTTTTIRSSL